MSEDKTGGPAFPIHFESDLFQPDGSTIAQHWNGMTLRDWFAGQVLKDVIGNVQKGESIIPEESARIAYRFADAMIEERNK